MQPSPSASGPRSPSIRSVSTHADEHAVRSQRLRLLEQIHSVVERPMTFLAFVWLALLILDLTQGLGTILQWTSNVIWGLFAADFLLEFVLAPQKRSYLRTHWLTALALVLPAFRVLRVFTFLRFGRVAGAARSVGMLRVLTSLNRGMGAVRRTFGRRRLGFILALTTVITFTAAAEMLALESPQALREAGYGDFADKGVGLKSYGEAVWWTAMIMTTMASEYWPKTAEGRVVCFLLAVYAFALFGYITATIAELFIGRIDPDSSHPADDPPNDPTVAELREDIARLRGEISALGARLAREPPPGEVRR